MILKDVSDEFLDWLDSCPVEWYFVSQTADSTKYVFSKKIEDTKNEWN